MSDDKIILTLSKSEALVFFEWLASSEDKKTETTVFKTPDEAEQAVLWRIEGKIESQLREIVLPNYKDLVMAAKQKVLTDHRT